MRYVIVRGLETAKDIHGDGLKVKEAISRKKDVCKAMSRNVIEKNKNRY